MFLSRTSRARRRESSLVHEEKCVNSITKGCSAGSDPSNTPPLRSMVAELLFPSSSLLLRISLDLAFCFSVFQYVCTYIHTCTRMKERMGFYRFCCCITAWTKIFQSCEDRFRNSVRTSDETGVRQFFVVLPLAWSESGCHSGDDQFGSPVSRAANLVQLLHRFDICLRYNLLDRSRPCQPGRAMRLIRRGSMTGDEVNLFHHRGGDE